MRTALFLAVIFFCSLNIQAQTFSATENTTIPDDGTDISFTINVSGLPSVIDTSFGLETVCLNLDHTWDSDLELKLIAPDGTTFLLFTGIGGDGDNFNYTCLNENAADAIATGTAPFTGTYSPMGDMGLINNGQNPNGIWTLHVYDTYAFADIGFMYSWSITFGDDPAMPTVFDSTTLPIALIDTHGAEIYNEPKTEGDLYIIDNGPGAYNHPTDTNFAYQGKILTELQGFTGPWYPKKNYDFDIVNDSLLEIDTVLLGLPSENDFIFKAEYLDLSLMKNCLTYEMSRRMDRYAPRTKYCELFVNGEYMGVYSLTEKIKRDKNRVDIDKLDYDDVAGDSLTGGYIIEINENYTPNDWNSIYPPINAATCPFPVAYKMVYPQIDSTQPEQLDYIHAYVDSFENALNGVDFLDTLTGYRNFISVRSFIDFMLVNEFSANYDSYGRSTFLYKENISDGGQLNIGPPWDYDRAYAPWTTEGWVWEITHPYWPFPFWWSKFREDPEWVSEVYCRWTSLREDVLSNDAFHAIIDSVQTMIELPAQRNFVKWAELGVTDYDYYVDELKTFVDARLAWMDAALDPDYVVPPDASFTSNQVASYTWDFHAVTSNAEYNWDFGDGTTSTQQSPEHIFPGAGDYTVTLTVNQYYGCSSVSTFVIEVPLDASAILPADFIVYPNPFSNQFTIEIPEADGNYTISIMNMLGETVMVKMARAGEYISIAAGILPAGSYMIRLSNGNKMWYDSVVKR